MIGFGVVISPNSPGQRTGATCVQHDIPMSSPGSLRRVGSASNSLNLSLRVSPPWPDNAANSSCAAQCEGGYDNFVHSNILHDTKAPPTPLSFRRL